MNIAEFHNRNRTLLTAALCGAIGLFGVARVMADEPKPASGSEAKASDQKPADTAKPVPAQPAKVDPHAGHNHGPAGNDHGSDAVGPPAPGAQPGIVKPGAEAPTPTVVLKPGEVPAVKFDTPTYDFGRVQSGADIRHDFYFTNTGTGPLEILQVKPSCGCTVAGQHDRIVEPGQSGKIPITMSVKNASGPVSKNITILTNVAGTDSRVTLVVKGEVWQPVQVTPQAAAFGRIPAQVSGQETSRKLTIVNNLETPVKLGTPVSNSPKFRAELATLEEGKKYELTVTMIPPLESGNINGRITIPTGTAEVPTLEIPAYAFITAAVDVTPNVLTIAETRTTEVSRQFYVRSNINTPIQVTDVTMPNENIKFELTDVKDSMTYRIKVDIPPTYVVKPGDQITFKTSHPDTPMLTIPINYQATIARPPVAGATPNIGPRITAPMQAPEQKKEAAEAKPAPEPATKG